MSENQVTQAAQNAASQTADKAPDKAPEDFTLLPPVDVIEDAGGITLYADLPGVPKDKLSLQVESDTLTIEGEVALDVPQGMEASHVEVGLPRYRRVFTLSKELDPAKTQAKFEQGVLSLRIPKAEHAQPRRIEVQVA
ncbi:MAG: Hsp20/alpha crystallin family protein [Burkholderiaceae bacterium]|uniref:Hsp20/alpha crystallin family protein n=1 Tax=Extensimonas perlucida TaxID=2590786 RepID=UPI0011A6F667|nr:Hsp20/alpha crystallin family protein [Extensimonas perlucida]MBC7214274.1 Hsp20/alpha crystallin family protein [Burkholderiaceae bacterium]